MVKYKIFQSFGRLEFSTQVLYKFCNSMLVIAQEKLYSWKQGQIEVEPMNIWSPRWVKLDR